MFIDPEPKRQTHSQMARTPSETSMASQYHSHAQRQHDSAKPEPLKERSNSEKNRQQLRPLRDTQKSTVRLVKSKPSSPTRSPLSSSDGSVLSDAEPRRQVYRSRFVPVQTRLGSSSSTGQSGSMADSDFGDTTFAESSDNFVSYSPASPATFSNKLDFPPRVTLLPGPPKDVPLPISSYRNGSASTARPSESLTLRDVSEGNYHADWTHQRLSQTTTLRDSLAPTPSEQDLSDLLENSKGKEWSKQGPSHVLETLPELSPERPSASTVRTVQSAASQTSDTSLWSNATALVSEPILNNERPQQRSYPGGLPDTGNIRNVSRMLPQLQPQSSQETLSEQSLRPSSPIIVLYDSDSSGSRHPNSAIRFSPSIESIQSRLQYPTVIHPRAASELHSQSSWASLTPSFDEDTLPPLQVPRRRPRQRPTPALRNPGSFPSISSSMEEEVPDTEPYPRSQFATQLSTILSESEETNRESHFSLGSGVSTLDDGSGHALSGTWPRMRQSSLIESLADDEQSSNAPDTARTEDYHGAATLEFFRQESAKPPPLFQDSVERMKNKRYDGPRPRIPPIPVSRDSDENFDTVSDLQTPSLRPKRSGYSLRRRSNSTPGGHSRHPSQSSTDESVRTRNGSSVFPTWARAFYGGAVSLMSPSKTSLQHKTSTKSARRGLHHQRSETQYTDMSITSRLGTAYSMGGDALSPASSHFLPSIFRGQITPRPERPTKQVTATAPTQYHEVNENNSEDSMKISVASYPEIAPDTAQPASMERDEELLPSGHPRWGALKDEAVTHRPGPRKITKAKEPVLALPRPVSFEALHEYRSPHLAPSKRASQSRMSLARPPSFVESLDSLVRSRANRQILLFSTGFVCPLAWMLAAVLPIPAQPVSASELEKTLDNGSTDDVRVAMRKHEAGDAESRWREENAYLRARWWRGLNRIMSVIGILVMAAVIAIVVVATR